MPDLAPCVAIIGPAGSGKSSLLHLLDEALQNHEDEPLAYVVKGSPDGSARYQVRRPNLRGEHKGKWIVVNDVTITQIIEWIENARQHLELVLVDLGGCRNAKALPGNLLLFAHCTHYLAVAKQLKTPEEEAAEGMNAWINDATSTELERPLERFAELESRIKLGEPFFDVKTQKGLFRGDAMDITDTLNRPVSEGLTDQLMGIRLRRTGPRYLNLRRSQRWKETDLPSLGGALDSLKRGIGDHEGVLLGGVAPIYAYAAALHHALDERDDAQIRVFDPKVLGGEVSIERPDKTKGPFPADVLHLGWDEKHPEVLVLKVEAAREDKFLPRAVLDALPALELPEPGVGSLSGHRVEIHGSGPIWLHLTLSYWMRLRGASAIGHHDRNIERVVWVWEQRR